MSEYNLNNDERRDLNQMGLDTFTFNIGNMFESSADVLIKKLLKQKKKSDNLKKKWIEKEKKTEEETPDTFLEYQIKQHQFSTEEYYRDEELIALMEMQVIYLFKLFEINLKKLISISFSLNSTKKLYRWESIIEFLKGKNIDLKSIKYYLEISQLRELNNSFKHSDSLDKKLINKIPEFQNVKTIRYNELELFYKRISFCPIDFLKDLSSKIFNELYNFDNNKLNNIANKISLRMNKDDAIILINKIKAAYEIK